MRMRFLFSGLLSLALAACGGGAAPDEPTASPARVEILDGAALLTETGQTRALTARVLDSQGREITATVAWESSRPENVGVSASGELTAVGSGGSSQITARVGNLRSAPMLAVHTPVAAGAVLLTDEQIVGDPEETSPGAAPSASNTYRVRLSGVAAPAVGDLLVNTGGKVVAGRVLAVQSADGVHVVTLALVPARELFPRLNIHEVIDLNEADVEIPEAIAAQYDVQRVGNTFTFTPKPGQVSLSASAVQRPLASSSGRAKAQALGDDFNLGPFACKPALDGAAGAGSEVMALTVPPLFTVSLNPRLDILSTEAHGLERLVLHSEPSVSIEAGLKTLLAVEGKVTCEADLFVIKIPVGGPVALIVGGQLPVGVGVELGGKLTAVNMGITVKGTARTSGDVGLACPAATGCAIVSEFGKLDVTATPSSDLPSLTGDDLRLEPTLSAYAFVKAAIGNPFLKSLRFDAFKVKAGMALRGNFAPQSTQASDAAYQSDYKLVSELKAGADTGFSGLAGFLGLNAFAETLLEVSVDVATTPAGALSADRAEFAGGDTVNFKVRLDPAKTRFLDVYNVERVILVRHKPFLGVTEVGSVTASEDQTEFDFVFTSPIGASAGRADEFYAFVVTRLLPFDVFALELGRAPAPNQIGSISAGHLHTCALTSAGGVRCWGSNNRGQLGNGLSASLVNNVPADVVGLSSGVVAVSAGYEHTCALTTAGGVKCWGHNGPGGLLGNGSSVDSPVPVDVSGLSSGVIAVDTGVVHTCALTQTGGVKCWGQTMAGALGDGVTNADVEDHFSATPVDVSGLSSGVIAISSGAYHSCAVTSSGTVKCWGANESGQLGVGTTQETALPQDVSGLTGVVAISAGRVSTCAVTSNGTVKCWGTGPGVGSAGSSLVPVDVPGLGSEVESVSAGGESRCALIRGGGIKCWGFNEVGMLGNGSILESAVPVDVSGLASGATAVSVGDLHACAARTGGAYQCWGSNLAGQIGDGIGDGTIVDRRLVPINVLGFP